MELTRKQEEGLKITLERYKSHEKYMTIAGWAGTGKSTLIKFIIEALGVREDKVAYACYTGKAAEVLRKKGNPNAMTLHKLLYDHIPKPNGGFFRKPKVTLDYSIVVVDEISLAPKSMIEMLLRHKVFCIFCGDNFQLPQIDKNESHDFLEHPHIFLDEIMRQAAESEIIQLTMKIRHQEPIPYVKGKEVIVIPKKELVTGHMTWANIILCATNATRHNMNNQMRQLLGFKGNIPKPGERIVFKRNYWDDCNETGDSLVNGMVGTVSNSFESFIRIPAWVRNNRSEIPTVICDFTPECGATFNEVSIDKDFLLTEQPCVDWKVAYKLGKAKKGDLLPKQATWGYALTTHSAQGSEWDNVLVIEESFPYDKIEHARWLYTAVSRSSKKCVLIK